MLLSLAFDDFMIRMPRLMRRTLSVLLMSYLEKRHKLSVDTNALESAFITGFNEKTYRTRGGSRSRSRRSSGGI